MTTRKRYSKFSAIKPQGNEKWVVNLEGYVTKNSNLSLKTIDKDDQNKQVIDFYINLENVNTSVDYLLDKLQANKQAVYSTTNQDNCYTTIRCVGYNRVATRMSSLLKVGALVQINGVASISRWESEGEQYNQLVITVYDFWVRKFPSEPTVISDGA